MVVLVPPDMNGTVVIGILEPVSHCIILKPELRLEEDTVTSWLELYCFSGAW